MPVVPRLEQRVQEQALPNVRVETSAPAEAFGGGRGLERINDAQQSLLKTGMSIYQIEKKKADDAAVDEFRAGLLEYKRDRLYNPKDGAYTRQGKDALGIVGEYGEAYDKYAQEKLKGLSSDEQRAMAMDATRDIKESFAEGLYKHTFSEVQKFDEETFKNGLTNEIQDAGTEWADPRKVAAGEKNIQSWVRRYAARNGKSADWVKRVTEDAIGSTHKLILNDMLAKELDTQAEAHYLANKDKIPVAERAEFEKQIASVGRMMDSKREADRLYQAAGGDEKAALDRVDREVKDPKTNAMAKDLIREKARDAERSDKTLKDNLFQSLWNHVRKTKELPTAGQMNQITPAQQENILELHRKLKAGLDIQTDMNAYAELSRMASHPATLNKFKSTRIEVQYASRLAPGDMKHFLDLQGKLKKDDKDPKAKGILTGIGITERLLDEAKIKDKAARGRFQSAVDERVIQFEQKNKRDATSDEIRQISNELMKQETISGGGFLGIFDSKKRRYELSVDDYPEARRKRAEKQAQELLIQNGVPVTPEALRDVTMDLLINEDDKLKGAR